MFIGAYAAKTSPELPTLRGPLYEILSASEKQGPRLDLLVLPEYSNIAPNALKRFGYRPTGPMPTLIVAGSAVVCDEGALYDRASVHLPGRRDPWCRDKAVLSPASIELSHLPPALRTGLNGSASTMLRRGADAKRSFTWAGGLHAALTIGEEHAAGYARGMPELYASGRSEVPELELIIGCDVDFAWERSAAFPHGSSLVVDSGKSPHAALYAHGAQAKPALKMEFGPGELYLFDFTPRR